MTTPAKPRRVPPRRFTLFRKLPTELRCMVWRHALPQNARVIEVCWTAGSGKYFTDALQPAILQVCQESRKEAQKIYTRLEIFPDNRCARFLYTFANEDAAGFEGHKQSPKPFGCYIDFSKDAIFPSCHRINSDIAVVQFIYSLCKDPQMGMQLERLFLDSYLPISHLQQFRHQEDSITLSFVAINAMAGLKEIRMAERSRCEGCKIGKADLCRNTRVLGTRNSWDERPLNAEDSDIEILICSYAEHYFDRVEFTRKELSIFGLLGPIQAELPQIPRFAMTELIRERRTRTRAGPYATRKEWAE